MATDGDLPLAPRQFRLRSAFVALTVCCVALAGIRYVPFPDWMPLVVLVEAFLFVLALTVLIYFAGAEAVQGPMTGAVIGTIGGGAVFGVMTVAYAGTGGLDWFAMAIVAAVVGLFLTGLFLIFGVSVAYLFSMARGRHDAWTGAVCGAVTGLAVASIVGFTAEAVVWRFALIPMIVVGCYGAFGAAVQLAHDRRRRRRRSREPQPDVEAVVTVETADADDPMEPAI